MWRVAIGLEKQKSILYSDNEPLPYRVAFFGTAVCFILILAFAYVFFNLSIWVGLIYFTIFAVISLAWARVRAEVGFPTNRPYYQFYEYLCIENVLGTQGLGDRNLAEAGFSLTLGGNGVMEKSLNAKVLEYGELLGMASIIIDKRVHNLPVYDISITV